MLSKTDIQNLQAQLVKDKEKLWKEIKELETPTDFGSDIGDPDDEEADTDEEFENTSSAADALRERLADIDDAINKIKTGEYGICEECGRGIELEVLQVAPETGLCMEDKKAAM